MGALNNLCGGTVLNWYTQMHRCGFYKAGQA